MVQEVVVDDDEDDEFEPLFSYQRVCKPPSDDDSDGDVTVLDPKSMSKKSGNKVFPSALTPTCPPGKRAHEDLTKETEDDDDWLPPPPKSARALLESKFNEDPTLREIRQAREELMRLAESRIQEDKDSQRSVLQMQEFSAGGEELAGKREKVLVTIQNKDGACKSFRQLKDEKFEKLFSKYAESIGLPPQQLVFVFDGQRVLEHSTPKDFDMEDEDIIEVNIKK
ncbi:hypothetical protein GOP47_0016419 [Adiantum capillus-veneris]|uniref:Ubiquitin-like domain-containing protein n=1 Tax=Adiantum capillus-veneris TaxID=13818 RepID=A0A9D4UHM5_ADICA|nr:hypothetical protein GOP47_0016419 [Adiantum capillus-veneris]